MDRDIFDIYLYPPEEISALGPSLRNLIHRMLTIESLPESLAAELAHLREQVDAVSARIAEFERTDRAPRIRHEATTGRRPYYVQGGLVGEHNPLVPVVEIRHADGVTSGTVRFGAGYEGPPGCVHGGFVALFFDGILGHHNVVLAIPAMTAKLEVRYRRPTPVLTDLRFEVRTAEITERRVVNEGWIEADGTRVSEARATFALPRAGNFMAHMRKRIDGKT
jgi:acyl-coenzyme A thioesterase PaaI-like protein